MKDKENLAYVHYQNTNNENKYLILEHSDNQEDLYARLKTKHLINFQEHIEEFVTEKPELLFLNEK
ncbi:putative quinol monooxygenase [Apilactobacillus quenuiae]|uniref:putative quinol monooxygenase n=1 Tax=Apilactobacillus quenuiae TaxID=2008377 RepID=UPI000D018DA0|nr:hypothetical protein [Apilactobacillus quenuiae]